MSKRKSKTEKSPSAQRHKTEKQPELSFFEKISAMPPAAKITLVSGALVMILGIYGLFQPTTPIWVYASTQMLLSVMFASMGYREMKRETGKKNYVVFYIGATLCLVVAMNYLHIF